MDTEKEGFSQALPKEEMTMVTKTVTLPFVHIQNGPKYLYTAEVLETFLKRKGSERIVSFGTYVLADPTYECSYDYLA